MLRTFRSVLMVGLLLPFVGCIHYTEKESSVKADNYDKMPKSIFVIYPPGPRATQMGKEFDQTFGEFATNCQITYGSDYEEAIKKPAVSPPDLKPNTSMIAAQKYDWALEIMPYKDNYIQTTMYGSPVGVPSHTSVTYNYTIMDMATKAKVWRANIASNLPHDDWIYRNIYNSYKHGDVSAKAVIDALRKDGLLTSCPIITK